VPGQIPSAPSAGPGQGSRPRPCCDGQDSRRNRPSGGRSPRLPSADQRRLLKSGWVSVSARGKKRRPPMLSKVDTQRRTRGDAQRDSTRRWRAAGQIILLSGCSASYLEFVCTATCPGRGPPPSGQREWSGAMTSAPPGRPLRGHRRPIPVRGSALSDLSRLARVFLVCRHTTRRCRHPLVMRSPAGSPLISTIRGSRDPPLRHWQSWTISPGGLQCGTLLSQNLHGTGTHARPCSRLLSQTDLRPPGPLLAFRAAWPHLCRIHKDCIGKLPSPIPARSTNLVASRSVYPPLTKGIQGRSAQASRLRAIDAAGVRRAQRRSATTVLSELLAGLCMYR